MRSSTRPAAGASPCAAGSRIGRPTWKSRMTDRKSTRLNSSHTVIYTLSLHDALPILVNLIDNALKYTPSGGRVTVRCGIEDRAPYLEVEDDRSEEHTSELQSHRDLHSFPTRRSSDLGEPDRQCAQVHAQRRARHRALRDRGSGALPGSRG